MRIHLMVLLDGRYLVTKSINDQEIGDNIAYIYKNDLTTTTSGSVYLSGGGDCKI